VRRGVMIRRNLLCMSLPDPPATVNTNIPAAAPGVSMRERIRQLTSPTECSGCHSLTNLVGFGLEHFDAIGSFRTHDNGAVVDATGEILGVPSLAGPFDGAPELAHKLGASPEVQACVAQQWVRFALGRSWSADEECEIDRLVSDFQSQGGNVRWLVEAIAT